MKFSTALAMGIAPLAMAKSVHNVAPLARRDGHLSSGSTVTSHKATEAQIAELTRLFGLHPGTGVQINFLWVNQGGGVPTTVIGEAQTVTVTETVVGGAATPAPGEPPAVVGTGVTHNVTVGGPAGLVFDPQEITANVGDSVIFTFLAQNHTVTQSAFETPCDPLADGMDSGFQANANNTVNPPPQVAMQIMVNTPLWFYCRQGNHCGKGMVFSINPTAEKTHAMFQSLAIQQRGNGAGSAITGNAPPAAPPAEAPAPPAEAPAAGSLAPLPGLGAAPTEVGGAPVPSGVAMGTGQLGADGTCICAVQCSFAGVPNAAVQGREAFGGALGSIPTAMVPAGAPPARRA